MLNENALEWGEMIACDRIVLFAKGKHMKLEDDVNTAHKDPVKRKCKRIFENYHKALINSK